MSRIRHVTPVGDGIAHDIATEDADCVCGPSWGRLVYDDGTSEGWAIVHAPLEREA